MAIVNLFSTGRNFATQPADTAVSIVTNATTNSLSRGIWIGLAGNFDFFVPNRAITPATGAWVTFNNCVAGTIIPIMASGARNTSDGSAPAPGSINFLN